MGKQNKTSDMTSELIIQNLKVISDDMRSVKHALVKLMSDINYCVTQGDVITTILEESQMVDKNEIPDLIEEVLVERESQASDIFSEIMEKVTKVSKRNSELDELKRILKNAPVKGEA